MIESNMSSSKIKSLSVLIKTVIKMLVYRPRRLGHIGKNSWFLRPWKIEGAKYIKVGNNCLIREDVWIASREFDSRSSFNPLLTIEDDVYIGRKGCIAFASTILIEQGCVLSEEVYVTDQTHGLDPNGGPILMQPMTVKPVKIGHSTFIGYRAAVMPGVTLGNNCVVAANSVVTKSFPAYSMIGGVPAKLIKVWSMANNKWEAASPPAELC